jgi:dienelactone hydrolase
VQTILVGLRGEILYGARVRIWLVLAAAACGHSSAMKSSDGGTADAPDAPPSGIAYDTDGTIAYTMETDTVGSASVTVWMPSSPGKHPAVVIACGSTQKAPGYAPYAKRLASYGIAAFVIDDPGAFTNTVDVVAADANVAVTWMPATFGDRVDVGKVGLAGHSRGGAVSLLLAEHEMAGKVVAWFGIDPVDNQFGMTPGKFARTDLPQLAIPTTYLGAQVTSNCAPAADSYEMLYPKTPVPSVLLVGIGAGHTQFEPPDQCTACSICSPSGTADQPTVLSYAVRYVTAFFARELLGDASVGKTFDGAGAAADIAAGRVTLMSK